VFIAARISTAPTVSRTIMSTMVGGIGKRSTRSVTYRD
jgi:hypothetical protein